MPISCVIFGGKGRWGKRICEATESLGYRVEVVEEDDYSPKRAVSTAQNNDVIFFSTPDDKIKGILLDIRRTLGKSKMVIDCATNKSDFANELKQIASEGTSVCSTHPMVNPQSPIRGHNVILMSVGDHHEPATQIARQIFVETMGMMPSELEFSQHGDTMVILQMVPHLIQRMLIDALGKGIDLKEMSIDRLSSLAPANYLLAELGFGRVAWQRSNDSAGIIAENLHTPFGKRILGGIQSTLGKIMAAGEDRKELTDLFEEGVRRLDPEGNWREEMHRKTDVALNRLGNLRKRSYVVDAPNKKAILRDILSVLADFEIDMTALDSQVIYKDDGSSSARFEIGITDASQVDFESLKGSLEKIGVILHPAKIL
jgi:prephenate dehydrogenase